MDELETTVNPSYDRGTLATTYQRIAADIEEGLPLIDDNIYSKAKYHSTRRRRMLLQLVFIFIICNRTFLIAGK